MLVRNIQDSLGKLPPQALDMEEAVLGALMLEKTALDKVHSFLKPSHFYSEDHAEIARSIYALHRDGQPIDMRTVVSQLRRTGKLEVVGGPHKIADLTSKVSSAANIEYHSRIIVEMAIKREMILIASHIHQEGYEDTTDAFTLVESFMEKVKDLYARETTPAMEQRIAKLWQETAITEEPPADTPIIKIDNETMCSLVEHSLVVGKKKSRKTLFIVLLIRYATQLGNVSADQIHIYDTEQGRRHVYLLREKIKKTIGAYVNVFSLRGRSCIERQQFIATTVDKWPVKPRLVIIDGVRDLVSNINDADETSEVVTWIERLINHGLHLVNILHLNKTDSNPRGHLGTELTNKAQTTFELGLTTTGETEVKCESSRDRPFAPFVFTHSQSGLPELVGTTVAGKVVDEDEYRKNLELVFEDGPLKWAPLVSDIKAYFKLGENKAKQLIASFVRRGWIMRSGTKGSKDAIYKLMTSYSPNGHDAPPIQMEIIPPNGHPIEHSPNQFLEPEHSPNDTDIDLPF